MNKKVNTVLFIVGATIANVLFMSIVFVVLFILFGRFLAPLLPPAADQIVVVIIFVGSIVLTYFAYHRMIKLLTNRVDMEKYFDPIFKKKQQ
ncbi:MAG: hypothetical protein ACLFO1_04235 [Spirochaetaceae bacterium]